MTKTKFSYKELIPQCIRYIREDANMSYEELSNKSGISMQKELKSNKTADQSAC